MIEVDVALARPGGFRLAAGFAAPSDGVTALFGRSGAGKTTIIQMVAGVVRPDRGRIAVDGTVFFDSRAGTELPIEARRVGYVFQDARLFPHMSVERNLRYGERRSRAASRPIGLGSVVDLLGLERLLGRRPHTLSGGERQRVAIGRALLVQPRLLLMDEPLASLDEARKQEILPYLERLRDELRLPVLYVSHAVEEVLRLADHMVALAEGAVIAAGPVSAVLSRPDLMPVLGRFDLGTVLDCTVARHDAALGLSSLAFADGELRVPLVDAPRGAGVRARVRARDVALALSEPVDISVTNRLPGVIAAVERQDGPYADVALDLGRTVLHALVTTESVERLALRPGLPAWALIKAVAVEGRSPGLSPAAAPAAP